MSCPGEIPRWKRSLDVVVILLALPLMLPLAVLVAVLIRMVSDGPVLFHQERVGYLGRKFMCFKFRTMFVSAETAAHQGHLQLLMKSDAPMTKLDARGDSRIIPFGRLLRSTGLDELPQLLNVLRGEMSLVGPRPCLAYECDEYLPSQRERFNTLPGLTGLWQVNGKNQTTFAEMMQLDISYTREKTLWLDLAIILKTVPAIAGQVWQSRKKTDAAAGGPTPAVISTQPLIISYEPLHDIRCGRHSFRRSDKLEVRAPREGCAGTAIAAVAAGLADAGRRMAGAGRSAWAI